MKGDRKHFISKGAKGMLLLLSVLGLTLVSFLIPSKLSVDSYSYQYENQYDEKTPAFVNHSSGPVDENRPSPQRRPAEPLPLTTVAGLPVLMYHQISNTPNIYNLNVPVKNFDAQMHYLWVNGYHTVSLSQVQDYLMAHRTLPSKPILITFDDGNKDNVTTALPILRQFKFTAAIFIAGKFIGQSGAVTLADIQTLASNGWDIGNHTFNHAHMAHLNPAQQKQELDEDNAILHKALPGRSFPFFAYPTGDYSGSVINTLKADGFTLAFTTDHGWVKPGDNPYELPRLYVGPYTSLEQFAAITGQPYYPSHRFPHPRLPA